MTYNCMTNTNMHYTSSEIDVGLHNVGCIASMHYVRRSWCKVYNIKGIHES